MAEVNKVNQQADKHSEAVPLGIAEHLSRQILSQYARHAEALHLLGLSAYERGELAEALERIEEAVRIKTDWEAGLNSLGMVLFALGRTGEAIAALQRATAPGPKRPEPYNNLGVALNHAHRYREALEQFTRALEMRPKDAEICNNIGITLQRLGRYEEAVKYHSQAADLRPDYKEAYFHCGRARTALEQYPQALADYRRVLELTPDWAEAYNEIGMTEAKQQDFEKALKAYAKAIELDSGFYQAYYNRANVLTLLGRYDEAVADFTKAVELHPDFADAYWNRGLAYLLKGDYVRGWADYAWRKHSSMNLSTYPHNLRGPEWMGEPFEGRRLLVHYEQGFGDSIKCWRFLPQVKAHGGTVIVEDRKVLLPLLKQMEGVDETVASSDEHPPQTVYDLHVSMLDLPRIFHADPGNAGNTVPYLRPPKDRVRKWAGRIDPNSFSIGIAWTGSPLHKNDQNRSARLNYFLPLGRIAGVRLYSLQKGPASRELAWAVSVCGIADLGGEFADFADTAGAITHLDLVISVDTAVLHLAGAMGRRAWGLLPFAPDWRWMRNLEVSPWYPTVRLFRQPAWGDWNEVFLKVIDEARRISKSS